MNQELIDLLGDAAEATAQYGAKLADIGPVVLESTFGRAAAIADPMFGATVAEEIVDEFGVLPHLALETAVSLGDGKTFTIATLLTIEDATSLLGASVASGDEIALQNVRRNASELGDLITLMLFTDSPIKGEIKTIDGRYDNVETTMSVLAAAAPGADLVRLEYDVIRDDERAHVMHILPRTLLAAIAEVSVMAEGQDSGTASPDIDQEELDNALLASASITADMPDDAVDGAGVDVHLARFSSFEKPAGTDGGGRNEIDLIMDVSLKVSVELGRTSLTVQEVLDLGPGAVVELDKLAGEPVDIFVNDRLIAHGEVVVVDENFGVRLTQIASTGPRRSAVGV